MKFTKTIEEDGMKLRGAQITTGKFIGLGYELVIGESELKLYGIVRKLLGLELDEGEEIAITKISVEFES
jgi:hypothetical protein